LGAPLGLEERLLHARGLLRARGRGVLAQAVEALQDLAGLAGEALRQGRCGRDLGLLDEESTPPSAENLAFGRGRIVHCHAHAAVVAAEVAADEWLDALPAGRLSLVEDLGGGLPEPG